MAHHRTAPTRRHALAALALATTLAACGGGGDGPTTPPPPSPAASIALGNASGSVVAGTSTTIPITVTRSGGFAGDVTVSATGAPAGVTIASQVIAAGGSSGTLTVATTSAATAGTTTISVTATGTGVTISAQSYALTVTAPASPITQIGSDITSTDGSFGSKVALSANGTRMVVGAQGTTNGTTRVYERTGTTWAQLGGDIVGEAAGDQAGTSVDINAAGTRIAIGAYLADGATVNSGHVRVYDLVGTTWTQVGSDIDGDGASWGLGYSVALSASGNRLVAGAPIVGGSNGKAKVMELVGGAWTQVGNVLTANNEYGSAVDISSDGTTIAVGAPSASGSSRAGTVQVYRLTGATWTQLGNTLQGVQIADTFGTGLSLTASGARIAVAAPDDTLGGRSGGGSAGGVVRVYDLSGATWTQVGGDILGAVGVNGENLGETVVISDNGTRVAASGASQSVARVFTLSGTTWAQTGANITNATGAAVRSEGLGLSADGASVAVGWVNGSPRRVRVFSVTP